jgi:hypothetical protein
MKRTLLILSVVTLFATSAASVEAKVIRFEVTSRVDINHGKEFGLAGPYEQLTGRVFFAVDPNDPHSRRIVDVDKAPRNAAGLVEFSSDLVIIKPKDLNRGNGSALVEIANRGGRAMVRFFDRSRGEDELGDGFLMRNGFTLVWVGWQFDVANGLRLHAPVATDNGRPITGWVRSDFVFPAKTSDASLGHRGQRAQMAIDPESADYRLTVRDSVLGERQLLPRSDWQFGRLVDGVFTRDARFIYLKSGFEPGRIYEVVYRTSNPAVVGLGLAAVRDLVSYLKYEKNDLAGVRRAIGFGISQSGRFLRHFLYQGFNADERDRQVFDGIDAHVAGGGHGSFNHRFAEPSRDASPFSTFFFPTDIFPFTDVEQTDSETGERDGLLTLTAAEKVLPKIFYTNSSYEYWGRAASLVHITIDGKSDAQMMDNVRIYYFPGGQHGLGQFPPVRNQSRNLVTPVDYVWAMRALLLRLNAWASDGTAPPESQYPKIADGTLTSLDGLKFPKIPEVMPPANPHGAWRVDYGPEFRSRGLIASEPPRIGRPFPVMVPQVNSDGIDLAGVRMPEVAVPLATFTGWNQRDPKIGAPDQLLDFTGSYLPFAKTKADRDRLADPRLSIEERYPSREQYLGMITEAALKLVKGGYLLADDLPRIIERAEQHWEYVNRQP